MTWYCYWQAKPELEWHLALAESRTQIVRDHRPPFMTILDADSDFRSDMTREDYLRVKYRGPLYFDFDSASLDEVIPKFKSFLQKLEAKRVNLNSLLLYATGGKGFHVLVPQKVFISDLRADGYNMLAARYRKMAESLYVDTLDLNIYSARRGRMFRIEGIQRSNDLYKVQISAQEALDMDPIKYVEVCATPRPPLAVEPPAFTPDLALLWSVSSDEVTADIGKHKATKVDKDLLAKCKGGWPAPVQQILKGEGVKEGVGYHKIAMQLAITANALGKSRDDLVADAEALCLNHASDSYRYNTPRKRKDELGRMYDYMQDNPCYEFSMGVLNSMLDDQFQQVVGDEEEVQAAATAVTADETSAQGFGLRVSRNGVYRRTEFGLERICAVGFENPTVLKDPETQEVRGYTVDAFVDGVPQGKRYLEMSVFASKSAFQRFTLPLGAGTTMNDNHVSSLAELVRRQVKADSTYVVTREGLDVIRIGKDTDLVYANAEGVASRSGAKYQFRGPIVNNPVFGSDLLAAPLLGYNENGSAWSGEEKARAEAYFKDLLDLNDPRLLSRMLGWMVACMFRPFLQRAYGQFPIMQVFGPAGSGKSKTIEILYRLYYYGKGGPIKSFVASTPFAVLSSMAGTASIPFIMDEVKRVDDQKRYQTLINLLRSNYGGDEVDRGKLDRSTGSSELIKLKIPLLAPTAILMEAPEDQTAFRDRSVIVPLTPDSQRGGEARRLRCHNQAHLLAQVGRSLLQGVMEAGWADNITDLIEAARASIVASVGESAAQKHPRMVFNYAVVMTGLTYLRDALRTTFGDTFDRKVAELYEAVIVGNGNGVGSITTTNRSEASKVIDMFAYLSRSKDMVISLQRGEDYELEKNAQGIPVVQIRLRDAYAKYCAYQRKLGDTPLYPSPASFVQAMGVYDAVTDTVCAESILKDTPTTVVYAFNLHQLGVEGVEFFAGQQEM